MRSQQAKKRIAYWLSESVPQNVSRRVQQIAAYDNVVRVAVMPDVHLAKDYCVGTAVATRSWIIPHAVGGDIGCGMAALRIQCDADCIDARAARELLKLLTRFVPSNKHGADLAPDALPQTLRNRPLSCPQLLKMATREGRLQLGTLGRGNHFLEFQSDKNQQLWLMVHSGSRAMGQAIHERHLKRTLRDGPLRYFESKSNAGQEYLSDVRWARDYAHENRLAMLHVTSQLLENLWSVKPDWNSIIHSDHNHVRQEIHMGKRVWVHRKGAQSAGDGELGVIPGSMGTSSYHVVGRGCESALRSSSHGAGRRYSRTEARSRVSGRSFQREMGGVFFDDRKTNALRDEAPSAYKDIRKVIKAQRDLVKTVQVLKPVLSYKGT